MHGGTIQYKLTAIALKPQLCDSVDRAGRLLLVDGAVVYVLPVFIIIIIIILVIIIIVVVVDRS